MGEYICQSLFRMQTDKKASAKEGWKNSLTGVNAKSLCGT